MEHPRLRLRQKRLGRSELIQLLLFAVVIAVAAWAIAQGAAAMPYRWQWQKVPRYLFRWIDGEFYPGVLLKGLGVTLSISAWAFVVMLLAGLVAALPAPAGSWAGEGVSRGA